MQGIVRTIGLVLLVAMLSYPESESRAQTLASTTQPLRTSQSADITVTGKVTSETGEGLPGVSVLLKGTSTGTSTNAEGKYSLSLQDANATLIFSYIGYVVQEIAINNRTTIDVSLVPDIKSLGEVVVVGYGSQKKSDVTGSLASVSSKQIQEVPVQNLTQAIQGRAAGVDVAAGSFRPGEVPAIRIRGNRSVVAGNEPLYVVDGIPLAEGTGLNDFNPQDILSMEILKDASATAIYGSRGANGVILISTKRGKEGRFSINYEGYTSIDKPLVKLDMFSGAEFAELRREANRTAGSYPTAYPNPANDYPLFNADPYMWESVAQGYQWIDKSNRVPQMRATTPEEKALYGVDEIPVYNASNVRNTDWQDLALRTGVSQSHQISASGGNEKLRALFSGGYLNQKGIQVGQDFSRYNARLSLDFNVTKAITLGGSANASLAIQNYGPDVYGKAAGQLPIAVPFDSAGNYIFLPGGDIGIVNPILDPGLVFDERRTTRFFGSFYGEAKLFEGLKYRVNFGPDFRNYRRGQFQAARSSDRQGGTSYARNEQSQNLTFVLENLLYYDKKFGANHTLGVTLLQSIQEDRGEGLDVTASNLPYESQKWYNLGSSYNTGPDGYGSSFSKRKLQSWMGRINYSFKDRYLVTASWRRDGSSVLAPGHKWEDFPSFALAWKVQQEQFMQSLTFVDELKLRVGYGQVGQSSVSPYQTGGTLQRTPYAWDELPAYGYTPTPGTLPNTIGGLPTPDLSWEKTATINAGLDFGFFQNRISGTVDLYQATTSNLLLRRTIPGASGYVNVLENIGETRNSGVEISLSTVNVRTNSGFSWSTDVIFTKNKEEFRSLSSGVQDDVANRWFIGQPLGVHYDYKFDGIWQNTKEDLELMALYNKKSNLNLRPGKIKVVDVNKDTLLNLNDQMVLGSTVPKWSGSITNRFAFKGFELSVLVYARVGQMVSNTAYRPGLSGRYQGVKFDYWTPDHPSNEFPRPDKSADIQQFGAALQYQEASFVKVRNISLTYTFPQPVLSRLRAHNLSVYVNLVNPFLFTNYKVLDPESGGAGGGLTPRSTVFGLRVGF